MRIAILLSLFISSFLPATGQENRTAKDVNIFVSREGCDKNPGTISKPLRSIQKALDTMLDFRDKGMIKSNMPVNIWLRKGQYSPKDGAALLEDHSGTANAPVRIAAYKDEKVIFECGQAIPATSFRHTPKSFTELPEVARGKVIQATITNQKLIDALDDATVQVSFSERMLTRARFPNTGFSLFGSILKKDRSRAKGTLDNPAGATVRLKPSSSQNWSESLSKSPYARLIGYMSSDWLKETYEITSVGSANDIQMIDGTRYGVSKKYLGRVYIENLLCELDSPGEWFYGKNSKTLYLWPPRKLRPHQKVTIWSGETIFTVTGAKHTIIENLTFQNLQEGACYDIVSGSHNKIQGCTFRNINGSAVGFNLLGTKNGVISCDFYDFSHAGRLSGGSASADKITPAENYVQNCHYTQVFSKSLYGKVCSIYGAGNIFRNNLVHNHNGQVVTLTGPDHLVELNELFNCGVEEGDGGSFYQGAMAHSWGNVFRHNFFHHIMCNPQMLSRAAIFSDDGDMGDTVVENVFYKAGEGFKINGGSGHYFAKNISIKGIHMAQVVGGYPNRDYSTMMRHIKNNPGSNGKSDLIGRAMGVFGKENWRDEITPDNWPSMVSSYWTERYPTMLQVFEEWKKRKSATRINTFENNIAYGYENNEISGPVSDLKGNRSKSGVSGFKNPKTLNLKLKSSAKSLPQIPFEKIGLYKDRFRTYVPNKDSYRELVRKHWENEPSAGRGAYEAKKNNRRAYFNTGLLIARLKDPKFAPDLDLAIGVHSY